MAEETPEEKTVREANEKAAENNANKKKEQEEIKAEDKEAQEAVNKSEDLISNANAAAIRIEEANKKQEELMAQQVNMGVEKVLGGKAEAGNCKRRSKKNAGRNWIRKRFVSDNRRKSRTKKEMILIKKNCKICHNKRKFAKFSLRDKSGICGNCWKWEKSDAFNLRRRK